MMLQASYPESRALLLLASRSLVGSRTSYPFPPFLCFVMSFLIALPSTPLGCEPLYGGSMVQCARSGIRSRDCCCCWLTVGATPASFMTRWVFRISPPPPHPSVLVPVHVPIPAPLPIAAPVPVLPFPCPGPGSLLGMTCPHGGRVL